MFKSKLLAAFVLSVALMPLNSIAMGEREGQPDVVFIPGGAQPAAQDGPAQAQPGLQQPAARQLAPAAGGAPAPAAQRVPSNSWSRLGRQLAKPIAFFLGAAALGGTVYAGNKGLPEKDRAWWSIIAGYIGGLTGMAFTRPEKDYKYDPPRVVRQGSFAASVGFAGTVATLGIAASHISNGSYSGAIVAYLAAYKVGDAMYYGD